MRVECEVQYVRVAEDDDCSTFGDTSATGSISMLSLREGIVGSALNFVDDTMLCSTVGTAQIIDGPETYDHLNQSKRSKKKY